jgi:1-acyl-sn-glycerol-3-phosphate acyltransferase
VATAGAVGVSGSVGHATSLASRALYQVARVLLWVIAKVYWRMTISGREHIPASGPYIVAPVHRSIVDSLVICAVTRRRLRYMGKAELWKPGAVSWFLYSLGGFPVRRGGADREALRRCIEVIEMGEPLVIFPEGTRQSGELVQELFEGASFVAARTGVPIIPVGIGGSEAIMPKGSKMIRPGRIHLEIGPPIPAPAVPDGGRAPRRAIAETTEHLYRDLQVLFDSARRRVGSGP